MTGMQSIFSSHKIIISSHMENENSKKVYGFISNQMDLLYSRWSLQSFDFGLDLNKLKLKVWFIKTIIGFRILEENHSIKGMHKMTKNKRFDKFPQCLDLYFMWNVKKQHFLKSTSKLFSFMKFFCISCEYQNHSTIDFTVFQKEFIFG